MFHLYTCFDAGFHVFAQLLVIHALIYAFTRHVPEIAKVCKNQNLLLRNPHPPKKEYQFVKKISFKKSGNENGNFFCLFTE